MGKFIISDYVADLDTAATRELRLRPSYSSGKDVKLSIIVCASVACSVEIFEDTSKQHVIGNAKSVINVDRNGGEVSGLQACHTPDAGGDGTSIWSGISAVGIPVTFPALGEKSRLARSDAYLVRVTALADNNAVNISVVSEEDVAGDTITSVSSSSSSCRSSSSSCNSSSSSSSSCNSSSSSCNSSSSSSSSAMP